MSGLDFAWAAGTTTASMGVGAEARAATGKDDWLARFWAGDRIILDECYREHFASVERLVAGMLPEMDGETVVHEVFYRLLSSPELRRSFSGGSLRAWLHTLARNQAIDLLRRARRDVPIDEAGKSVVEGEGDHTARLEQGLDAHRLIERFRRESLPAEWAGVFETRFLQQLDQREAARRLGISRTTLAYRELRIRSMLRRFVLRSEER
jgi:RNA polymerase sigma-70 factor (ECF subfamily)